MNKYEEALERARESLKDGGISQNTIDYLTNVFPELAESEDEKIRKSIIDFINRVYKKQALILSDEEREEMLVWLEKQGEQKQEIKLIFPKFRVGDRIFKTHNSDINKCGIFLITKITEQGYWYNESVICAINEEDEWELVGWSEDRLPQVNTTGFWCSLTEEYHLNKSGGAKRIKG